MSPNCDFVFSWQVLLTNRHYSLSYYHLGLNPNWPPLEHLRPPAHSPNICRPPANSPQHSLTTFGPQATLGCTWNTLICFVWSVLDLVKKKKSVLDTNLQYSESFEFVGSQIGFAEPPFDLSDFPSTSVTSVWSPKSIIINFQIFLKKKLIHQSQYPCNPQSMWVWAGKDWR